MVTLEQRRAELVPGLARLARKRDFRASLRAAGVDNTLSFVPVLPEDRMSYVFGRLEDSDGRAVVAMPGLDGEWSIALMFPATRARVDVAHEDDLLTLVHDDCEISMLFEYLQKANTIVIQQVAARLLTNA